MTDAVAELLADEDNDLGDAIELHAHIAAYYKDVLTAYEEQEDEQSKYVSCFKYEDPIWQVTMAEWLYHLSYQEDREQPSSNSQMCTRQHSLGGLITQPSVYRPPA